MTLQSPNEALQPEAAPPPPTLPRRRRRPTLAALSGFLSFLLIAAVVGMFGLLWSEHRLREPGPLSADKLVYIAPGTEFPDIISQLDREGVVDSPITLNIALVLEGSRGKVKAGEYLFHQSMSLREVMDTLVNGRQVLHALTVPEGLTSEQIVQRLRDNDILAGDIREMPKEGTLLPETYKFTRGMLRADLLKKMQDDQRRIVDQIWARRATDLPLRSPYEMITLASIVEKETGKADERPRVAGVFMNRLQKRMRLQSDPTIVYGLVGGRGTLGRPILRSEVERATPYNTYAVEGLPPGPIANPGRAALEAVANPSRTQELYFVADGTGGHVFADSLDQHNRNVVKWRQIEKDAKEKLGDKNADVDKAPAVPAAPGGREQRSDAGASVYGVLPKSFDGGAVGNLMAPSIGTAPAALAIAKISPFTTIPQSVAESGAPKASAYAMGPGLDDLAVSLRDPSVSAAGAAALDGPVNEAALPPDPAVFQASSTRRAEQRAKSAKLGLAPLSDTLPNEPEPIAQATLAGVQPVRRGFDASEGTKLDPLLDKTYDLNYAKTVPAMR